MHISQEQIDGLQQMYKKYYGEEISAKEISDGALSLMEIFPIICQPLTQEDLLMVEESRKEIKEKLH